MTRSQRAIAAFAAGLAVLGVAAAATATTYPARVYPGSYFAPRLPDTGSCFERHYGQLRNVCTTPQMVVASWSPWQLLAHPGTSEQLISAPIDFNAWVFTSSTGRVDECEAVTVDREGWAATWTGRVATTANGWQNLHIGHIDVHLIFTTAVVVECTIGRTGRIGTIGTFADVV